MDDAGAGRDDAEVLHRLLGPAEQHVPLPVALVFEIDVLAKAIIVPKRSTWTEWSITRSTGTSGLILLDIAAQPLDRRAHRRQIDHAGDAGEILEDDTRRQIGQLDVRRGFLGIPVGEGRHVIGAVANSVPT